MTNDIYGNPIYTENDIFDLYMQDPTRKINFFLSDKGIDFDEVNGVVFTPLIVEDLGYTDDQKIQMLREEEIRRYKST